MYVAQEKGRAQFCVILTESEVIFLRMHSSLMLHSNGASLQEGAHCCKGTNF